MAAGAVRLDNFYGIIFLMKNVVDVADSYKKLFFY